MKAALEIALGVLVAFVVIPPLTWVFSAETPLVLKMALGGCIIAFGWNVVCFLDRKLNR
jgi:hypothetical protein